MNSLSEAILKRIQFLPEGSLLSPQELHHLGSRDAVNQAFSRLVKNEQLMRVSRGLYVAPITSRFGRRAPATEKVISALASKTNEVIVVSGARSANTLGLTRQVPAREVFFTTGRPRALQLGKLKVKIEHAPQWQMALGATGAGEAIRALAWLGQANAREAVAKLRKCLPNSEWQALQSARDLLPTWIAEVIGQQTA